MATGAGTAAAEFPLTIVYCPSETISLGDLFICMQYHHSPPLQTAHFPRNTVSTPPGLKSANPG
jgi:hypothetical protein